MKLDDELPTRASVWTCTGVSKHDGSSASIGVMITGGIELVASWIEGKHDIGDGIEIDVLVCSE
jgi:hypothetical protein